MIILFDQVLLPLLSIALGDMGIKVGPVGLETGGSLPVSNSTQVVLAAPSYPGAVVKKLGVWPG